MEETLMIHTQIIDKAKALTNPLDQRIDEIMLLINEKISLMGAEDSKKREDLLYKEIKALKAEKIAIFRNISRIEFETFKNSPRSMGFLVPIPSLISSFLMHGILMHGMGVTVWGILRLRVSFQN
jgi:hypothetical protein